MTAGYSGTPLAKKLTLKDGMCVWFDSIPDSVRAEIEAGMRAGGLPFGEGALAAAAEVVAEA